MLPLAIGCLLSLEKQGRLLSSVRLLVHVLHSFEMYGIPFGSSHKGPVNSMLYSGVNEESLRSAYASKGLLKEHNPFLI